MANGYDPYSAEAIENPYPFYRWLRDEARVYRQPEHGFYVVSRYEDVNAVLRNYDDFSSAYGIGPAVAPGIPMMITMDPPDHIRLRRLATKAFTPRSIALWEDRVRVVCNELFDRFAEKGSCDLIQEFAYPLPVIMIAEMLGVAPEDRDAFKRWSDVVIDALAADVTALTTEPMVSTIGELTEYFGRSIAVHKAEPRDDLITALVTAREESEALTAAEINGFLVLLLVAGNETTTNLIGNGALAAMQNPDQAALVRADRSLMPAAVEEALRYDAPIQAFFRYTLRDVEVGGGSIPAGNKVMVLYASANRDERRFPDPDTFDITRDAAGHVAFGAGIHLCLGAPLARLEGRVALETFLARVQNVRPDPAGTPTRLDNPLLRGMKHLPVLFDPV